MVIEPSTFNVVTVVLSILYHIHTAIWKPKTLNAENFTPPLDRMTPSRSRRQELSHGSRAHTMTTRFRAVLLRRRRTQTLLPMSDLLRKLSHKNSTATLLL